MIDLPGMDAECIQWGKYLQTMVEERFMLEAEKIEELPAAQKEQAQTDSDREKQRLTHIVKVVDGILNHYTKLVAIGEMACTIPEPDTLEEAKQIIGMMRHGGEISMAPVIQAKKMKLQQLNGRAN